MILERTLVLVGFAALGLTLQSKPEAALAAASRVTVPAGAYAGARDAGPAPAATLFRIAIELAPREDLDALAARMTDPASPDHRRILGADEVLRRFGRHDEASALTALIRAGGATDVHVANDGLVAGGIFTVAAAERFFHASWHAYAMGTRTIIAPTGPLTVPAANVRDVRGAVLWTTPRLADTRAAFTYFRGDWYEPTRFRSMTQAVDQGGASQRIVLVEDASDRFDIADVTKFLASPGSPPGADLRRVTDHTYVFKAPSQDCGRDDRGQEAALDVQAAITAAPLAEVVASYDDVCSAGNDGTLALARALDLEPTVIVFPFAVGPARGPTVQRYGKTPLPFLEAMVRGIPVVVPSGDDGAYGYRENGVERPDVAWPCVSIYVVCAGGTQLGDRDGVTDEAPWNDLEHAGGGGLSEEPRPSWQDAPAEFAFSPGYVKVRMVPDVSADAAGHLRIYWHGYGLGGVGGTSESAALVGGTLAAINSLVGPQKRLLTAGDLYALARTTPAAFRDITRENDRGWRDNTLRPRRKPLAKTFRGVIPTPAPFVQGCAALQPDGCTAAKGYDSVTGIGSIMSRAAVDALR